MMKRAPPPRLTHFLSMPIGHHPALRERVTKFTDALCANSAAIPGMDKSIVIMPRRLRFTLGAMTLSGGAGDVPAKPHKSLAEAQEVLQSLQPRLLEMLAKAPSPGKLRVPLSRLDVVHPYHNNPRTVHSVFVGPAKEDAEYATFHAVANEAFKTFKEAGFLVNSWPTIYPNVTLISTKYRQPRAHPAIPLDYPALLDSKAFADLRVGPEPEWLQKARTIKSSSAAPPGKTKLLQPVPVNLGTWDVDELQLAEMGNYGPEGEHLCVGKIALS